MCCAYVPSLLISWHLVDIVRRPWGIYNPRSNTLQRGFICLPGSRHRQLSALPFHYRLPICIFFNSLWPSDAMWLQWSGSTLTQVMACCLMVPIHYLNHYWLIINEVLWHSAGSNFMGNAQDTYPQYDFENYKFNIKAASPGGQSTKYILIHTHNSRLGEIWVNIVVLILHLAACYQHH